ncbi:hypothetical protein FKW77_008953 [Venturia effusa]|uniref:Uncharacterized protein n=1 Tax=Venturia effusa TaxID=50376 RepID=A0A517LCX1_9PEZI|nr:hypothetical protein FKW77_008953 [Venturia effusa]
MSFFGLVNYRTAKLSSYPPDEGDVENRIPVSFGEGIQYYDINNPEWDGLERRELRQIHEAVDKDLEALMKKITRQGIWRTSEGDTRCEIRCRLCYVPIAAKSNQNGALRFFQIGLFNNEEHFWPLVHSKVREIVEMRYVEQNENHDTKNFHQDSKDKDNEMGRKRMAGEGTESNNARHEIPENHNSDSTRLDEGGTDENKTDYEPPINTFPYPILRCLNLIRLLPHELSPGWQYTYSSFQKTRYQSSQIQAL